MLSRGTTLIDRIYTAHSITNGLAELTYSLRMAIGSSNNAEAASQTTVSGLLEASDLVSTPDSSPGKLERELRPASTGPGFQSMPQASLSDSVNEFIVAPGLLSSVIAL